MNLKPSDVRSAIRAMPREELDNLAVWLVLLAYEAKERAHRHLWGDLKKTVRFACEHINRSFHGGLIESRPGNTKQKDGGAK